MSKIKAKVQFIPDRQDPRKLGSIKIVETKKAPQEVESKVFNFLKKLPKWTPIRGDFVRPGFKDAAHFLCERYEDGETGWTLVHGIIKMKKCRRTDYYLHAWCEKGNLVVDRLRGIQTTKVKYYKEHKIENEWYRYGIDEAKSLMVSEYQYGPWEPEFKMLILSGAMEAGISGTN